ncbi:unnamed protein product [Candida verbasci]|uniref:Protein transport protein SEC23 n=1 Tax=Candida verbasci TaxID=1227364 RepID=A0A9W4TZP6_9ASCO|nr:unnamed protein product [Candida verbasci]
MIDESIRFNWNVFPSTKLEETQISTPIGCLFTPFSKIEKVVPRINKIPIKCQQCETLINPFIKLDRANDMWWCPFCKKRTYIGNLNIPESAKSAEDWPMELRESSKIIEYELPRDISDKSNDEASLVYVFVIDKYQHIESPEEFQSLLDVICESLNAVPENGLIGLITFDSRVYVHDLTNNKKTAIVNDKQFSPKESANNIAAAVYGTFLIKFNHESKTKIIDHIKSIKPTFSKSFKPERCTGFAHFVYSVLLSEVKNSIGNVLFFTSGPGTQEPGKIVDCNSSMRSHQNIIDLEAPYLTSSLKFYTALSYITNGLSISKAFEIAYSPSLNSTQYDINDSQSIWATNLFVGSIDQVGAYEMKPLIRNSNGVMYSFESFKAYQLLSCINQTIKMVSYKSTLEVSTSTGLKTSKLLFGGGYALPSSYHKASKYHHMYNDKIDDQLGEFDSAMSKKNYTNRWKFNKLNKDDTISIFFKMDTVKSSKHISSTFPTSVHIQYRLKYWSQEHKKWYLKLFTICKPTTNAFFKEGIIYKEHKLLSTFDRRAWIVLLTRLLINKIDTSLGFESFDDLIKLIDTNFTQLLHHFGGLSIKANSKTANNPHLKLQTKYEINENFKDLPSLIYNLRKNYNLIRIFNSSPDETAFYHLWFMRMNLNLSLKVIEPELIFTKAIFMQSYNNTEKSFTRQISHIKT